MPGARGICRRLGRWGTLALTLAPLPVGGHWSLQLGGPYAPAQGVRILDRDRHARPVGGLYNVCYLNAFQAQPEELGWWRSHHPALLLTIRGHPVIDRAWNEQLLDVSTPAKRAQLARIEGTWLDGCARAGFQAADPDNLDSWQRSGGRLARRDNAAFARLLIARAHRDGLAIGQKNTAELIPLHLGFDFAVVEECSVYSECGAFTAAFGRRVLEVEYTGRGLRRACTSTAGASVEQRDLQLVPRGSPGFVERWCSRGRLAAGDGQWRWAG